MTDNTPSPTPSGEREETNPLEQFMSEPYECPKCKKPEPEHYRVQALRPNQGNTSRPLTQTIRVCPGVVWETAQK